MAYRREWEVGRATGSSHHFPERHRGARAKELCQRTPAEKGYDLIARQVAGIPPAEGAAILGPSSKRYKHHARLGAKVPIDSIVRQGKDNMRGLKKPVQGINHILAFPEAEEKVGLRH